MSARRAHLNPGIRGDLDPSYPWSQSSGVGEGEGWQRTVTYQEKGRRWQELDPVKPVGSGASKCPLEQLTARSTQGQITYIFRDLV